MTTSVKSFFSHVTGKKSATYFPKNVLHHGCLPTLKKELKTEPFSAWCPLKGPNFSFTLITSLFFSFSSVLNIWNRNIFSRNDRGSHWRCTIRKGFLENFAKFTGKHLCQSLNCFVSEMILTHFWPKVTCYTPENTRKPKAFWCIQGV